MATLRLVLRGGWWVGDRDRARAKAWHRWRVSCCVPIGGTLLEESLMIWSQNRSPLGTAKIPDCQCDPRRGLDDGDTTGPDLRM